MTLPSLPPQNDLGWYAHYTAIHNAAADVQRVAEVWDRFTDRPDGAIVSPKSGKPYTLSGGLVGATALPRVAGGKLTYAPTAAGAGYASIPVSEPLRRVGGRFSFGTYTTNVGSVGLLGWAGDVAQTFPVIPDSPCHFIIGPATWAYGVVTGNALVPVASGTFATPLVAGTVYSAEVYIDRERSTAYVFLPDGSVQVVSHALIGSVQAAYAGWELYRETTTDAITAFHSTWADSNSDSPMARVERAVAAQGAIRALTYAPSGAADVAVPTSLTDIDATNLTLPAFIAPTSGRVLVEFTGYVSMTGAGQLLWGIANGGASLGVQTMVNQQYSGQLTLRQVLNVSAGSSYSLKWQHFCTTASVATFKLLAGSGYIATMTVTPLAA